MDYQKELNDLIDITIKEGASDLHLSSGYPPTVRVSGMLIPLVKKAILTPEDAKGFMNVLLTPENKELFLREKEVDFS